MNQPLRIELYAEVIGIPADPPLFDLIEGDGEEARLVAAIFGDADTDEARTWARLCAHSAPMFGLLRAIHSQATTRPGTVAINYDQWLRDVSEVVTRIEEGA